MEEFIFNLSNSSFIVTVKLDYIRRQPERYIKIICENGNSLYCDFINKRLEKFVYSENKIEKFYDSNLFDYNAAYIEEMREFLGQRPPSQKKLTTLRESIKVVDLLEEN